MERAAAADWYSVTKLQDDVCLIAERFVTPFYRCNIFFVRGRERNMLVDSGMGVVSLTAHVPLVTEKLCIAVASHTHFDHIGCHHEFAERLVHAAEADILAHPDRRSTLADPYVSDAIFERLPPLPYASREYGVRGARPTRILHDGDIVDLGDRRFEVVHTPGHSPGGIALWEAASGILFSGDIVYDGPLVEDAYHADAEAYVASMRRLLELPVRIVHGGHFASFGADRHEAIVTDWLLARDAG